jgi:hypothetical protein
MGREGFEPSTLGLRVDAGPVLEPRHAWANALVQPNELGRVWVLWCGLVDLLLTCFVACLDNASCECPATRLRGRRQGHGGERPARVEQFRRNRPAFLWSRRPRELAPLPPRPSDAVHQEARIDPAAGLCVQSERERRNT